MIHFNILRYLDGFKRQKYKENESAWVQSTALL